MNKQKIIGMAVAGAFAFGACMGYGIKQETVSQLERKLEAESNRYQRELYDVHLELIKQGNPYEWELDCDALGSCGYRRWWMLVVEVSMCIWMRCCWGSED